MIALDRVSYSVRDHAGRRVILDHASFAFTPGIWHVSADPTGDARLLVRLLAGYHAPAEGRINCRGPRSWPVAQFAPFGPYLTGLDIIDTLCSLYAVERRGALRLFHDLLDQPQWLAHRFDRWPQPAQRQFGHIAVLAPVFETYLLDLSPVLPDGDFYRRWSELFRRRTQGRTVIIASGQHRAARRDFAGIGLVLAQGTLRRAAPDGVAASPALAAE